jgi:hypothetical protein
MGARLAEVTSATFLVQYPNTTIETVIATVGPISLAIDGAAVILRWFVCMYTGTASTGVNYRLRRGTDISGTLLGAAAWLDTQSAGVSYSRGGGYVDNPGVAAGLYYSLSVQQVAATGNATVKDVFLAAMVL